MRKRNILSETIIDRRNTQTMSMAFWMVSNNSTIREVAREFNIGKSTVFKRFKKDLPNINKNLYNQVSKILAKNKAERHLRGGQATKAMYAKLRRKKNKK